MSEDSITTQEKPKIVKFNPVTLNFTDFQEAQPEINKWILVWSNMGLITPNFFLSYRDALGNYHTPDSHKQWVINAWAYLDAPIPIADLVESSIE